MDAGALERLTRMAAEHAALMDKLASPEVASDHAKYAELARKAAETADAVALYDQWKTADAEVREARELARESADADEVEFYNATAAEAQARVDVLEGKLHVILTPRDPRDDRPVIVEIRPAAGGEEAALFAGDLLRMYTRFAERRGWKTEMLDATESDTDGIREAVFELHGQGAWSALQWESGVHRVQRVPKTESSGRIHTSTATVAVLPEAEEVDVEIADADLRIDTYRSSGPGGQHVNTTDSAVRITHLASGIVVAMQSERSQRQNRERAMRVLRAKLQELAEAEAHEEMASARRDQVKTGARSERIRTYNYPQDRITDDRLDVNFHNLPQRMDGDIDDLVQALKRLGD